MDRKRKPDTIADEGASKNLRLADDRVAALPAGANLIETDGKSCTHEVAWPPGISGSVSPPPASGRPPAREYPFLLDPFQQTAINALEAGERMRTERCMGLVSDSCVAAGHSVLVAAHTSAGKTVVAEYAFAMALR